MKPVLFALLALMGLTIGQTAPAHAALTLCNRTSYVLYAATAAARGPQSTVQGWTRIAPGACEVARKEPLTAQTYLVHARTGIAHSGPPRAWGGNISVCVRDGNFSITQPSRQAVCNTHGTFALPFAVVGNRGGASWTMNFDEQPPFGSLAAAQLAGVKRLLKDNGYRIDTVTGTPDRQTGIALNQFRTQMRFSPRAGNAELFRALESRALERVTPAGYTVCNDSREILLLALGIMDGGKPVSRGWWTVQAGACAKLVTTPLNSDAVYLLAQTRDGTTVMGGPQGFCTTSAAFEIKGNTNCTNRGFTAAGFARTAVRGRSGTIIHVGGRR